MRSSQTRTLVRLAVAVAAGFVVALSGAGLASADDTTTPPSNPVVVTPSPDVTTNDDHWPWG